MLRKQGQELQKEIIPPKRGLSLHQQETKPIKWHLEKNLQQMIFRSLGCVCQNSRRGQNWPMNNGLLSYLWFHNDLFDAMTISSEMVGEVSRTVQIKTFVFHLEISINWMALHLYVLLVNKFLSRYQ